MPTPSYPRRNCGYGNTLDIYPNGDVSPCLTPRFIRGNIINDEIQNVFNWIDNEREDSLVDRLPECKTCDLRHICGGGCHLATLTVGQGINQVECDDLYKERMLKNLVKQFEATISR
ncbi:SPASM domain-containing protein [Virgibacillus dokdonensis]|nr:SPASM domain-containing protein [Virgibacillus dokdonensis]